MKSISLQLLTTCLEDGRQGVFVGLPMVFEKDLEKGSQVEDIWFSEILKVPIETELVALLQLIQAQVCSCSCKKIH